MNEAELFTCAEARDVKRDMELVRKILLTVQAKSDLIPEQITIEGVEESLLGRHIEMLFVEGFIKGIEKSTYSSLYKKILVIDLSWEGHEFIGAIAKEDLWQKLKDALGPAELAGLSLKAIKDASIAAATVYVKRQLGI